MGVTVSPFAGTSSAVDREHPLVIVLYRTPLLCEALAWSFHDVARVIGFPAARGDAGELLRFVDADAVVVDGEEQAEELAATARELGLPLVHVMLTEEKVRVLDGRVWREYDNTGASPERICSLLFGELVAHGHPRRAAQ